MYHHFYTFEARISLLFLWIVLDKYLVLGDVAGQVCFFSFVSTFRSITELSKDGGDTRIYSQLSKEDDSPFSQINLPWKFNFLGENINRMFASPNGGLHSSLVQPCPPGNIFGTDTCDLSNSYYNMIGGILTDLNPSTSPGGNITSYTTDDYVVLTYTNIVYYGTTLSNSFRIIVFKDSHIEIIYDKIQKTTSFPTTDLWSSGIRMSVNHTYVHLTKAQLAVGTQWGTAGKVAGIYPDIDSVSTGNQFNICPVSRDWCVSPDLVSRNTSTSGNSNPSPYLLLTSTLLGCAATVQFGAIFTTLPLNNTDYSHNISCEVVQNVTLKCKVSDLLELDLPVGVYYATPAWRLNSSVPFTPMPVLSLQVNITDRILMDTEVGCSNNVQTASCAGNTCALCTGNFSCLDLPCPADNTTSSVSVGLASPVYNRATCANDTCPIFGTDNAESYYRDYLSACCPLSAMDCSGRCWGTYQVGTLNALDATVTCCSKVDCAGVCDGASVRDVCGTCRGTDTTGAGCFLPSDITIVVNDSVLNDVYPIYSLTEDSGLLRAVQVNVTNRSNFQIQVFFTQPSGTISVAPTLALPAGNTVVDGHRSKIFDVLTSMKSLMAFSNTTWGTKTFNIQFRSSLNPPPVYTTVVNVYPAMTGCASLSSPDTCMRLPGCIYCFTSENWRILRERFPSENGSLSEANEARRLFIEFMPESVSDGGQDLVGICGDGWLNGDCNTIAPYGFVSEANYKIVQPSISIVALALFTMCIFTFLS